MKRYIDADRLKAENERLQRAAAITMEELQMDEPSERMRGELDAYDDLLSFIDFLQHEQPCDTCTNDKGCVTCKDVELWEGKPEEVDLEKEIEDFLASEDSTSYENAGTYKVSFKDPKKIARHFAQWQKSQMLKDAVEVIMRPDDCEIWVNLVGYGYKFNDGDKAKIVIIPDKEDDK